jgi:D-methionine transport system substrate-binding protein
MKKTLLLTLLLSGITTLSSCNVDYTYVIRVGASATPHAEILQQIKPIVKEYGYKLKIIEFKDYNFPNFGLEDGDLDANYFQHITYLNEFNQRYNTHLSSVANVHYEPLGIYSGKKKSLSAISNNDKVIVPNDPTNEARALLLLEQEGLITLDQNAGINATKHDIISNPYSLDIYELSADMIAGVRTDGAYAVIPGNYAIGAKLNISDALAIEDSTGIAATAYANVIAVKEGNEDTDKTNILKQALLSQTAKDYIVSKYAGAVIPLF